MWDLYSDLNRPALEEDPFFQGHWVQEHTWTEIDSTRPSSYLLTNMQNPEKWVYDISSTHFPTKTTSPNNLRFCQY